MTVKLRIEKHDLPEAFKVESRFIDIPDDRCREDEERYGECSYCYGTGCNYVNRELWVKFPKSGWLVSYLNDIIVFDNKFANDQFREELEEHGVPYVRC